MAIVSIIPGTTPFGGEEEPTGAAPVRNVSDTGVAISELVARSKLVNVSDTGVSASSASSTSILATRSISDTGATITSSVSLGAVVFRSLTQAGATITDSVSRSTSAHNFSRTTSDTLTFTDAVKLLVHPSGPVDRGVALIETVVRGRQLQPGVIEETPGIFEIGLSFVDVGIDTVELDALIDDTQGRIRLFIQAPSSAATVTVTRTHPSNTIVNVRGMTLAPLSSNIFLGYDYEAPIGRDLRYQASAYDGGGSLIGQSSIETITWNTSDTWLKDPLNPSRNIRVLMADPGEEAFDAPTGLNTILGRPTPIIVTEVRQSATGTLGILTLTDSDAGTLHLLTSTGNILLVQTDPSFGLGNLYFALQKIASDRVTPLGFLPERSWGLQYVETDVPVGVATGGDTTWALVLVGYATWNALLDTESSWLDLLENIDTLSGPPPAPTLAWRGA